MIFFAVDGLNSCVAFLENNPSFSACIGKVMQFQGVWVDDKKEWTFSNFRNLTPSQIAGGEISERLCQYIDDIAVSSYAVHRSHVIKKAYQGAQDYGFHEDSSLPEFALNAYTLVAGSLGVVDTFFHFWFSPKDKRSGMNTSLYSGNNKLNWFDKIFSDKYRMETESFVNFLTQNSVVKTQSNVDAITYVVKCFWGRAYFNFAQRRIEEAIDHFSGPRRYKKFVIKTSNFIARQDINALPLKIILFFRNGIRLGVIRVPFHRYNGDFRMFKQLIKESMIDERLRPKGVDCKY